MLCFRITQASISRSKRAVMLREAFVWSSAPHGKYYWTKEHERLRAKDEITPKAFKILRDLAERPNREFKQLDPEHDNSQLTKALGIDI